MFLTIIVNRWEYKKTYSLDFLSVLIIIVNRGYELENISAIDLLNKIAVISQKISRVVIRSFRACILSNPHREFCDISIDESIWKKAVESEDVSKLKHVLDDASAPFYIEIKNAQKSLDHIYVLDTYLLRRIEVEVSESQNIAKIIKKTLENGHQPQRLHSFYKNMKNFKTDELQVEDADVNMVLKEIFVYLHNILQSIETPLNFWASSIITDPIHIYDEQKDTMESWKMISKMLPAIHIPGEINEDMKTMEDEFKDNNPYAIPLFKIEEACYVSVLLLSILASASGIKNYISTETFHYTPSPDEGWSGGDGLTNILLRIRKILKNTNFFLYSVFPFSNNNSKYWVMQKFAESIWKVIFRDDNN